MAQNKFDIPSKETNDYDDDYDNDGLDDSSDDAYDDDERYAYSGSLNQNREDRRGNSFSYSGSGHSNEINEDNRKDHHNQLERKRRASIKSSYTELREAIPLLRDNKASRSVILQKAVDYLEELNRRKMDHVACVDHFSSENSALEAKCRDIENQVHVLLRQQRQNGFTVVSGGHNYANSNTVNVPLLLRMRDEEDSNDPIGSMNSTPNASSTASTSRSITSSSTTSTNQNEVNIVDEKMTSGSQCAPEIICDNHRNPTILDTGSNSSSAPDYYDDIEDIMVPPKKPRTE